MRQYLVDTQPTFRLDVAGTASLGTALLTVTRGNGTVAVPSGTATDNDDGTYDYEWDVDANTRLDHLKLDWVVDGQTYTTYEEICGSLLYTVEQARVFKAKDDASAEVIPLGSSSSYSDLRIEETRTQVTDDLERWTGRSWIARYARVEFRGNGSYTLDVDDGICRTADGFRLSRPGRANDIAYIIAATDDGTDVKSSVVVDDGVLRRTDAPWSLSSTETPYNVVVEYVYGLPNIVNGADEAALLRTLEKLVPSGITDHALTVDSEYGTVRLVQPGGPQGNVSRNPRINAWVVENSARAPFG